MHATMGALAKFHFEMCFFQFEEFHFVGSATVVSCECKHCACQAEAERWVVAPYSKKKTQKAVKGRQSVDAQAAQLMLAAFGGWTRRLTSRKGRALRADAWQI